MLKTVQVITYEERTVCDACHAKSGADAGAVEVLRLGERTWDLCADHATRFGVWLADALDAPQADRQSTPEPCPDSEPEQAAERAPQPDLEPSDVEPARSVMIAGEVPGYDWSDAREAVRNLGYQVVGRADDSTVLLILGEGGDRNGTKLRDAADRAIPCMDVREPGRFKSAVTTGQLNGGDPLPEPARVEPKAMSERERNKGMRAWAREQGYSVPSKGRIPSSVRHAYELTHRDASEGKAVAA
ncbi:Lsr2 family DNA-binding protein [Streptomyces zagrosensis]|uniref:Lsr2 DNA-binding domain-containing protein n=1 Tax=Streptomyces zagrosensis TaxID=1042984 RepID=A0A7W9QF34_9ACTN|nr:histone-like nucleoid-structuring protein Lsr2 [Streptomyces zagrosensis]MBB5938809.1 hypothetical protein [Streptomyces zagrosensis]